MPANDLLRSIPSIDELASSIGDEYPHDLVVREARRVVAEERERIRNATHNGAPTDLIARLRRRLQSLRYPSLRHVINATGVILHTNLGRAPLPSLQTTAGYSNLEYDLTTGKRGKRDAHIDKLIEVVTGATGIAVNNNAAAVYLVLNELAAGHEVIVSRGELIEIGDGFRIPDIMTASGAILREVGTTNRTHLDDYRTAINERTRLILRVHPSNFHITGFTDKPDLRTLAVLAKERSIPLYEDLGSGCVVDLSTYGVNEPLAQDSLCAGVDVVSFSGDKLLGGPQAGIIAGRADLVTRIRRNPMYRALRLDKLIIEHLASTFRALLMRRYDDVPALRMIGLPAAAIRTRAERVCAELKNVSAEIVEGRSVVGGGSTPDQSLPTYLIAISGDVVRYERELRSGDPPIIARIEQDRLMLDLRTVDPEEDSVLTDRLHSLK